METTRNYKMEFKLHGAHSRDAATLEELFARNSPLPEQSFRPKTELEQKVTDASWRLSDETWVVADYETRISLTEEDQHQLALLTELELTEYGQTGKDLMEQTSGTIHASLPPGNTLEEVQQSANETAFADAIDALSADDSELSLS